MKHAKPMKKPPPEDWSLTGKRSLPAGSETREETNGWLIQTLEAYHLPPDLIRKLEASLAEALSRARAISETPHSTTVKVFVSQDVKNNPPSSGSWGFFKLEKAGSASSEPLPEHEIEYYLYVDV
jgi:hypothetical protein